MVKKGNITSSLFSINQLSSKIKNRDISPVDLVEACLYRIKKLNLMLNSFITVIDEQKIYKQAEISEKEIKLGKYRGPLHGIPFSIKDMFHAKGIRFTAGIKDIYKLRFTDRCDFCKKNEESSAILIDCNYLNEFASGITGKNPFYGGSKNPWDLERIWGGSNRGSAVAVATGMALVSLGSDTGGSIRVPSALCGVVGLKPTYNLISKNDVFPLSPSLDHVGCIIKSVRNASIVLQCLCKKNKINEMDKYKDDFAIESFVHIKNQKIVLGVPKNYFFDFIDYEVKDIFYNFVKGLSPHIFKVETIKLHKTDKYYKIWRDIRLAEASEIH